MRQLILVISILCLVLACKENKIDRPKKPENLIPEDKMVEVLYDMAILSAAKGIDKRMIENKGINPEEFVFNKHNIDSTQFALSNNYYSFDLKKYQQLYKEVKLKLQEDKKRFRAELDEAKRTQDSISDANRRRRDSIIKAATQDARDGLE